MDAPVIRQTQVKEPVQAGFLVLTISDTRTRDTDVGGKLIQEYLTANRHRVEGYEIVKDDPTAIRAFLEANRDHPTARFIILTGGTGISKRDNTFPTIRAYLDTEITGFGEIFRWLSYQDMGSPAILSRATAGLKGDKVIFSLPGSPAALRVAMEKLILPEIGHYLHELSK